MTSFYLDKLYPLQDKVLQTISAHLGNFPLYLTGGTCLSRGYFNHRFSQDLDLFYHDPQTGTAKVKSLIDSLSQAYSLEKTLTTPDLQSVSIEGILKVDFVRDVGKHWGPYTQHQIYPLLDNLDNILANKITAIMDRDEVKDIVDFWIIAKSSPINWPTMFTGVDTKAAGILPPLFAKRLDEFPLSWLSKIDWIMTPPLPQSFKNELNTIINQILEPD